MNWTEGNLNRHARGRGWSRDLSRQKQVFATRARKTPNPPNKAAATGEGSPFFSIRTLKEPSSGPERKEATSPPVVKRRRTSPVASHIGDGLDARRRRLLERPDWTGISACGALQQDKGETASCHYETSRCATPGPRLHHPKPVRRDGTQLVRYLESNTRVRSESTTCSHLESSPIERVGQPPEPNPYPRAAASVTTAETEDTDNLLPLSDTLPDVSVRLDIMDPAGGGDRGESVSTVEDDLSLAGLLSSLSDESLGGESNVNLVCPESHAAGGKGRYRRDDITPEGTGCNGEDNWLDFIFEDWDDEEEVKRSAFEVAKRDAAKGMAPSVSSGDSRVVECDSGSGCGGSDRATWGTVS